MLRRIFLLFVFFAPASSAGAQERTQLTPGERLRVTMASSLGSVQIGRFETLSDATLQLSAPEGSRSIPLASISRLEASRGRKPNLWTGLVGLTIGTAAGGALGCAANRDSYGVFCGGQSDTKVVLGVAIGGLAGAAAGAILFPRERWIPINVR